MKFIIRKKYEPTESTAQNTDSKSLTQQQFQAECDVNTIMAKYRKTNMITHLNNRQGNYGDFTNAQEYQDSLNRIQEAQEAFESIPAEVRFRFNNDPARLIDFLSKPENNEEAIKLGLRMKHAPKQETIQESMEKALENNDKKRTAKNAKKD